MNAAVAKLTLKQHFQSQTDEQLQQYHLTHDYFTGRPLAEPIKPRSYEENADVQQKRRNLDRMNEVLYPAPTLASVLGDALTGLKLVSETQKVESVDVFEKQSECLVNRAKACFAQYEKGGLESLLSAQSSLLTEANLAIIKQVFSHNTVLTQNVCTLSDFWIRSPLDWDSTDEKSLFEHLFVQYEAPAFLKSCWSRVADEDNLKWLLCYIMYVQGGSLKALVTDFGWTPVSSKLWHQLFNCPASMLPEQAVLYAEFKRLGGWNEDFACLMANEAYVTDLLDPVSEEGRDFWYDTCRWTISKQFDLLPTQNSKVLWWARHQFTEFARRDESYRLQGRSLTKVLDSIAEYDHEQAQIARARARMAERARQVSMERNEARDRLREQERLEREELMAQRNATYTYDYDVNRSWNPRGWNWTVSSHGKTWVIRELTTSQQLQAEGEAMSHCVGGYSDECYQGHSAIFSLSCDNARKATIELDPLIRDVNQMQGPYNAELKKADMSVIKKWMLEVVNGSCYW